MASKSVTAASLPPFKPVAESCGIDTQGPHEKIRWALNGMEAISSILLENIEGETKGHWSNEFMWHMHQGQQALMSFARYQAEALNHELWYTHALLGDYGDEAKARAEAALKAAMPEATA